MKKLATGAFIVTVALCSLALNAQAADPLPPIPPMPESFKNIQVAKPDPSVPKEIADFLGEWEGVWVARQRRGDLPREVRRAKLILYEVTPIKVKYLWGVGANPDTHAEAKWEKYESDLTLREREKEVFPPRALWLQHGNSENRVLSGKWRSYGDDRRRQH